MSTIIVKRGDISEHIIASGNANASGNAPVYSSSTGIVEELYIENGAVVTEGQELMKIKSSASDIEQAQALASYQNAVSLLNTTRQSKITNQSLLESGRKSVIDASVAFTQMTDRRNTGLNNPSTGKPYSQDEIDSITSSVTSTKKSFEALEKKFLDSDTTIQSAQSAVSASLFAYQATQNGVLNAPVSGMVMNLAVSKGDAVKAKDTTGFQTGTETPVLRLSSGSPITIVVKMNEIDVAKVHPGQKVTVIFDSISNTTFDASISRIDAIGENINAVVTYSTYVTLEKNDERIRSAMTATVTINTETKKDVLLIPNTSLKRNDGEESVEVLRNGKKNIQKVTIGIKNEAESEVLTGLSEGDTIFIPTSK